MVGHRLRELREKHNLTQKACAEQLHISPGTYRSYETGSRTPSLETLYACAKFYHVSLDYIYERTDSPDFQPILSEAEAVLLRRYRTADERGQDTIRFLALYEFTQHQHKSAQKQRPKTKTSHGEKT